MGSIVSLFSSHDEEEDARLRRLLEEYPNSGVPLEALRRVPEVARAHRLSLSTGRMVVDLEQIFRVRPFPEAPLDDERPRKRRFRKDHPRVGRVGIFRIALHDPPARARIFAEETCAVCLSSPPALVLSGCWHKVLCEDCAARVAACPVCRKKSRSVHFHPSPLAAEAAEPSCPGRDVVIRQ